MSTRPPIVSATGDISVHILEDIDIPLIPAPGGPTFAGLPLFFEVIDTDISIALVAHPSNAAGRLIHVTPTNLLAVGTMSQFAIVERGATERRVRWSGRLTRYA